MVNNLILSSITVWKTSITLLKQCCFTFVILKKMILRLQTSLTLFKWCCFTFVILKNGIFVYLNKKKKKKLKRFFFFFHEPSSPTITKPNPLRLKFGFYFTSLQDFEKIGERRSKIWQRKSLILFDLMYYLTHMLASSIFTKSQGPISWPAHWVILIGSGPSDESITKVQLL